MILSVDSKKGGALPAHGRQPSSGSFFTSRSCRRFRYNSTQTD
jgi:hypothetical protein